MLRIKDKFGKTKFVLGDEDDSPQKVSIDEVIISNSQEKQDGKSSTESTEVEKAKSKE